MNFRRILQAIRLPWQLIIIRIIFSYCSIQILEIIQYSWWISSSFETCDYLTIEQIQSLLFNKSFAKFTIDIFLTTLDSLLMIWISKILRNNIMILKYISTFDCLSTSMLRFFDNSCMISGDLRWQFQVLNRWLIWLTLISSKWYMIFMNIDRRKGKCRKFWINQFQNL